MARLVRIVALTATVAAVSWTIRLLLVGGASLRVGAHVIKSYDPMRPIEVACVALVAFVVAGGGPVVLARWRRARSAWPLMSPVAGRRTAVLVAAAVFGVTVAYSTTAAGGADSSGYVSQADRWLHGSLKPSQPLAGQVPWPNAAWTFTPLGYTPVDNGPAFRQAPTYSPGLPLLFAAAKAVGGQPAMFLVVPLCGAVLVLASYGIGRRLRGPFTGVAAAWFMATSPIMIMMAVSPMSDVPAGAAWASAFYWLLGDSAWSALTAGLCAALAITIRPNLFFLAGIMGVWFLIRRQAAAPPAPRRRVRDLAIFAAGAAPGVIFIAVLFDYLFGSPLTSGYGHFSDSLEMAHVWPNLTRYASWAVAAQPIPVITGLAGCVVPFVWPKGDARRATLVAAMMLAGMTANYVAYLVFGDWTYLRFFLPAWPLLMVGAAGVIVAGVERLPFLMGLAAVVGILAIGTSGVVAARDRSAFDDWHVERHYVAVSAILPDFVPPNSVVFCLQESGALRYYSGRTPIRYDVFDGEWLDRSVAWLAESGVQSYAVLEDWELERFRAHFPDQERLRALETPIAEYRGYQHGAKVFVYNLTAPPPAGTPPTVITERDPSQWRDWPPGPEPTLVFKRGGTAK